MFNLKKRIVQKIKYELGIDKLERANESLLYVLNHSIDITKLPPVRDSELRNLQNCDTMLLAIFDKICKKHGLTYWLNYGSLLGAYRHKGFIPWDDDMDVSMLREDLDKMMLLKNSIEDLGLSIRYAEEHCLRCLVLGYKENETGIWVDIFPADTFYSGASEMQLQEAMREYKKFYNKNIQLDAEILIEKKREIIDNLPQGNTKYIFSLLEGWLGEPCLVYNNSDIFPLTTVKFEQFFFCAPNNIKIVLEKRYGKHFMEFPQYAINNHGKSLEFSVSQRARNNGVDMNKEYQYLKSLYESL